MKACIDELNSIYVALTRPQYELYVFIPEKSAASVNKARFLIPQVYEWGKKKIYTGTKKIEASAFIDISPSTYKDWVAFLKDEFQDLSALRNREKIMHGNIMHSILSFFGDLNKKDKDVLLDQAIDKSRRLYPSVKDFSYFKKKINALFAKEDIKQFFYLSSGYVEQEKEIVNSFGELKRIDRLVVTESQVWVIDFKSSAEDNGEYYEQIKEYISIVTKIYPEHKIRGFLIYLDELRVEEVKGQ